MEHHFLLVWLRDAEGKKSQAITADMAVLSVEIAHFFVLLRWLLMKKNADKYMSSGKKMRTSCSFCVRNGLLSRNWQKKIIYYSCADGTCEEEMLCMYRRWKWNFVKRERARKREKASKHMKWMGPMTHAKHYRNPVKQWMLSRAQMVTQPWNV